MAFIDDTSNRTSNHFELDVQPSVEQLIALMQHDSQILNDLLWSSDGALELSKCTFHHIRFEFDKMGRPSMMHGRFGPDLVVTSSNDEPITIKQLSNYEAHKLLGGHKEPAGTLTKQGHELKTNCSEHAKVVINSTLDRHESLIYYRHIYIPSVTFPLALTLFTESQMDSFQAQANRQLTRKCGYHGNTPMVLLYGPSQYGGPTFHNLMDSQGIQQIQQFIKHWRTDQDPDNTLKIAISWWQFVAGIGKTLMEVPEWKLSWFSAKSKYINSIRQYLLAIGGTLEVDNPMIPPMQRERDVYIMEELLQCGNFSQTELKYINLVRLHLQIVTLADMTTANGKTIDKHIKSGSPISTSPASKWIKCQQERPQSATVWKAWTKACNHLQKHCLQELPLGQWLHDPNLLRCQWSTYYHPNQQSLYVKVNEVYHRHIRTDSTFALEPDFGFELQSTSTHHWLPSDSFPVEASRHREAWKIQPGYQTTFTPEPTPNPTTFREFLDDAPEWERRLYFGLDRLETLDPLQHALLNGTLLLVSDGSAPEKASFGWTTAHNDGTRLVTCYGPANGYSPSSYRAEGYGSLSVTCFISRVIEFFNLQLTKPSRQYCDNKGLLDNLKKCSQWLGQHYPNETLSADWDVLKEIMEQRATLAFPPSLHHVKGHQDDSKPKEDLPLPAQLNIEADALADEYMAYHYDQHRKVHLLPHAGWGPTSPTSRNCHQ